ASRSASTCPCSENLLRSRGLAGLFDAETQTAPGSETESRPCRRLLDDRRNGSSYADEELPGSDEADAVRFEEAAVDLDVAALDLAALEHAFLADDEARVRREQDRAALEMSVDLDFRPVAELELGVLQH